MHLQSYIENSDLSIANLETTLAGESIAYSSYPTFNTPDALAVALKNAGFDVISTINNHTFDKGTLGFERTLSTLKNLGFDTVGTRSNIDDNDYIIKDVKGIKLGITSYSYGDIKGSNKYLNGIQVSDECKDKANIFSSTDIESAFSTINNTLSNLSNTDMQIVILHWGNEYQRTPNNFQKELAQKLSDESAFSTINNTLSNLSNTDMQIVILHWGNEYQRTPNNFQKELAQKLSDAGVDIIIGSHPHVVQPVEMIKSSNGWGNEYQRTPNNFQKELAQKLSDAGVDIIIGSHPHVVQPVEMIKSSNGENDTLVVYSLGNLISNQRQEILGTPYTEDGLMVTIDITKDSLEEDAYVSNVTCIPTWVNKYTSGSKLVYEIVPLEDKTSLNKLH